MVIAKTKMAFQLDDYVFAVPTQLVLKLIVADLSNKQDGRGSDGVPFEHLLATR